MFKYVTPGGGFSWLKVGAIVGIALGLAAGIFLGRRIGAPSWRPMP